MRNVTGIDLTEVLNFTEKNFQGTSPFAHDIFEVYRIKKEALSSIRETIKQTVKEISEPLLILVDELDRCRPDHAISYLETIKHIFDIQGVVFILAVNREQLESSAKAAFGAGLDFSEYYRKFVQQETPLPVLSEEKYRNLVEKYISHYLQSQSQRDCRIPLDVHTVNRIVGLVFAFKMTPRQIQEIFRLLGHTCGVGDTLLRGFAEGAVVMSVLKIYNPGFYNALREQSLSAKEILEFFVKHGCDKELCRQAFILCCSGGALKDKATEEKEPLGIEYLLPGIGADDSDIWKDVKFSKNRLWGYSCSKGLQLIGEKIDGLASL